MRGRTLVILLLLTAALGAFVWFVERDLPDTEEREERATKLVGTDLEAIEEVTIESDGRTVRLVRGESTEEGEDGDDADDEARPAVEEEWRLVEPLAARADASTVGSVLGDLLNLEKDRTLTDVDAAEYGLESPEVTVRLRTEKDGIDGERVVRFGDELPLGTSRAVSLAGEEGIFVVAGGIVENLRKDPDDWRSRELAPLRRAEIDRVRLRSGDRSVLLARRGDDFWIESPVVDLADQDEVGALLGLLTGLRAVSFLDEGDEAEELAEFGLDDSAERIEIFGNGREEPLEIRWGAAVEEEDVPSPPETEELEEIGVSGGEEGTTEHYARIDGQVVTVEASLAPHLERSVSGWRSPTWTSLASYEVDAVTIRDVEGELALAKVDGEWQRDGEVLPYPPVNELVRFLTEAEGWEIRPISEVDLPGPGEARVTVELRSDEPPAPEEGEHDEGRVRERTLRLYLHRGEGAVYGTTSERDVALLFDSEFVEELESKLEALRGAETTPATTDESPRGAETSDDARRDVETGGGRDE